MDQSPHENEQDQIAIANRAEELMLRTRQVARRVQERLWTAVQGGAPARAAQRPAAGCPGRGG
jgi:hypothetical protein